MKKYLVSTLAIALIACTQNDDKKSDSKTEAPLPTSVYQVKKVAPLSESQKEEMKALMGKSGNMPKTHLFFDEKSLSEEAAAKKQKEIAELSGIEKQIFEKVKADCEITHPNRKEKGNLDNVGEVQFTQTDASITGNNCPILHDEHEESETTVLSSNFSELQKEFEASKNPKVFDKASASFAAKSKRAEVTTITSEDLQTQTGLVKTRSEMSSEGTFGQSEGKSTSRIKATGTLKFDTKAGPAVEATILIEMAQLKDGKDAYLEADFKFPSLNAVVQGFLSQKEGAKYYLNGVQTTPAELQKLFGVKILID